MQNGMGEPPGRYRQPGLLELRIDVDTGILDKPAGLPTERLRHAAKALVDDERATPWITSHWSREPSYPGVSRWPWYRNVSGELE